MDEWNRKRERAKRERREQKIEEKNLNRKEK